jgi:hypothetical protein
LDNGAGDRLFASSNIVHGEILSDSTQPPWSLPVCLSTFVYQYQASVFDTLLSFCFFIWTILSVNHQIIDSKFQDFYTLAEQGNLRL